MTNTNRSIATIILDFMKKHDVTIIIIGAITCTLIGGVLMFQYIYGMDYVSEIVFYSIDGVMYYTETWDTVGTFRALVSAITVGMISGAFGGLLTAALLDVTSYTCKKVNKRAELRRAAKQN